MGLWVRRGGLGERRRRGWGRLLDSRTWIASRPHEVAAGRGAGSRAPGEPGREGTVVGTACAEEAVYRPGSTRQGAGLSAPRARSPRGLSPARPAPARPRPGLSSKDGPFYPRGLGRAGSVGTGPRCVQGSGSLGGGVCMQSPFSRGARGDPPPGHRSRRPGESQMTSVSISPSTFFFCFSITASSSDTFSLSWRAGWE